MNKIVAIAACPQSVAHEKMAAEALKSLASRLGVSMKIESPGRGDNGLSAADIAEADAVLVASDSPVQTARFAGKPVFQTRIGEVISKTSEVLDSVIGLISKDKGSGTIAVPVTAPAPAAVKPAPVAANNIVEAPEAAPVAKKKIVSITSCPTGIAHTFMAAKALQNAATALGHEIKVETQGSVGAKNTLTAEEIAAADAVIIAADTNVDLARFAGKRLYTTSTKAALHNGKKVIEEGLSQPLPTGGGASGPGLAESVEQAKAARAKARTGAYKHLMTGVSHMLPIVVAGGLAIALAFAIGGIYAGDQKGTLAWGLSQIGGATAFHLFVAVFSGFIAFSIADRPGLAPGLIGGYLAQNLGAGFLGGIASGFLAGYFTKFLNDKIRLPDTLQGLKPVLILPFLSSIVIGLLMIFVIAPPVQAILNAMTTWLNAMQGANAILLGVILGTMMAFDMGGPINKAAYTFAVGLLASKVYAPMAAVMAAGMTPPLGLALASWLFKKRFEEEERKAGGPAFVLGLCFITEGAIPFAAKDPLRVIPALIAGSAVAGAISMVSGVTLLVPHGGIFAALIPGAVTPVIPYVVAIIAGSIVTTVALFFVKKPLTAPTPIAAEAHA
ncbi:MAG TPA: PTS fructose-like transporter subunit IIB [Chthoniobacterales bacterium]